MTALAIFTLAGLFTGTMAWFVSAITISDVGGNGETDSAYYESGSGTLGDPFIIANTRHLNNFAWLQYNGTYSDGHYYFRLKNDIILESGNEFYIPPIGTTEDPFIGVFDGNNKKISGIVVTNDPTEFSDKPTNITYNQSYAQVIGFFGVVGDMDEEVVYSSSVNSVHNLKLDNITIHSQTTNTLIGLAAGFVNGDITNVTVGKSTIDVDGCQPITSITDNLSDYSLVGYTSSASTVSDFTKKISENFNTTVEGGNVGGFGASIAFRDFNDRIHNMIKSGGVASTKLGASKVAYKYYEKKVDSATVSSLTVARGGTPSTAKTYLEGDINSSVEPKIYMLMDNRTFDGTTMPGTVQPLQMDENYEPTNVNTGYIVSSSSGETAGNIRSGAYPLLEIINSIQHTEFYAYGDLYKSSYSSSPHKSLKYTSSNLAVLTNASANYPASNRFVLVKDDYNSSPSISGKTISSYTYQDLNRVRYKAARDSMHEVFTNASAQTYPKIHGIHFMDAAIAYNSTVTAKIKMNGIDGQETPSYISNFPLLKNSIDFNFKKTGYVTCFAGAYYASSETTKSNCFFSIFDVNRGNNYSLSNTSVKKISQIYLNNDDSDEDYKYIYKYSDNSYSDGFSASDCGALQFDMQYVESEPTYLNCLYYFEIPLNKGEYALGSVSGGGDGGYLLYLDIGANGQSEGDTTLNAHYIETTTDSDVYPEGVDFSINGLSTVGGSTICIAIAYTSGTVTGTVDFVPSTTDATVAVDSTIVGCGCCYDAGSVLDDDGSTESIGDLSGSGGGYRLIVAEIETSSGTIWTIEYKDELNSGGSITSSSYEKIMEGSTDRTAEGSSIVPEIFTNNIENIRDAILAVTLEFEGADFSITSVSYAGSTVTLVIPPAEIEGTEFTITYGANYSAVSINPS